MAEKKNNRKTEETEERDLYTSFADEEDEFLETEDVEAEDADIEAPKKFTEAEMIILLLYIGFTDLVGLIIVCFALDDVGIIDAFTFPVTQVYFRMKGVNANLDLIGNAAEVVPYIGALPLRTIACWLTMKAANNPSGKAAQLLNKVGKLNKVNLKKAA